MKEYYEFIDEKSSKFWEIEVLGNSFKVRYGKIGSAGQCQEKVFGSEQEAALEADKLTKEKVKKGYIQKSDCSEKKKDETTEPVKEEKETKNKPKSKPESKEKVRSEAKRINYIQKSFVKLDQAVQDILSIGDIVIFWGNNTITGYHTTSNRIIWKINTEKFLMGTDCNKKIFSFNNKALFVTAIKPGADFVFCVDPQDGRILWAFTERINTEYRVIPSNTRGNLVPIINVRKENMVRKQYLVFIDLETGEKVKEICFQEKYASLKSGFLADDQLFICGAQLEKKLDLSVYNDEAIFRMDMNHLDGDCVKLMDGGVCSIYQKENYVYYILEYKYWNEDKKIQTQYTINQYDLKTGQNTSIPWPERANPFILQEIMDDYILASDKLMISWGTKKYEKGERKAALFDFNLKKFLWTDTYEYDFISTCDGIFFKNYESLRDYRDGSVIETNVQFGQYYAKLFYADDAFYFNIGEGVEVHIRGDLPSEVLQASSDRMKEYDFREEIKKFNIREYGLSNI